MGNLEAAIGRVPLLATASGLTTARLAGLTNVNHLIAIGDDRYVLRLPGEGTSEYINRADEEVAADRLPRHESTPTSFSSIPAMD
jgi:hypothetical protein